LGHTGLLDDGLNLKNISEIYRHALLAKTLGMKPSLLIEAITLFGDPFTDATGTLNFVTLYNSMSNAGFTIQQLTYVISGTDDTVRPLGPNRTTILKTTKTLFDGLNNISTTYPDVTDTTPPDSELATTVTTDTTLIFDSATAPQISAFLNGTFPYTTNAPIGLTISVTGTLKGKLSYFDPVNLTGSNRQATITVIGILTPDEIGAAKALSSSPGWSDAVDRAEKKAEAFFDATLFGIFPNIPEAKGVLLAGDVVVAPDKVSPDQADPNTAPAKQRYFLKKFVSYLRDQLSNQLVITTMGGQAGISSAEITRVLLAQYLKISGNGGASSSALSVLRDLQKAQAGSKSSWTGYLIPPTSATYNIVGYGDTRPDPVVVDGYSMPFTNQQADPNNVWWTDDIPLTGGRLYLLDAGGQSVPGLAWKTPRSPLSVIPNSALLPDYSTDAATNVFVELAKAAIFINGFSLDIDEINYLQSHSSDFAKFDVSAITLPAWERVLAYTNLRNSLPKLDKSLIDLFKWASTVPGSGPSPKPAEIALNINKATNWVTAEVAALIEQLNLSDPVLYLNEAALVKLQTAVTVVDKIGTDIPRIFKWADPLAKFWPSHAIAIDMHNTIRSRYSLSDWEQLAQPLHNELRMNQRDALIAYLVVQPVLKEWGVVDVDSLFEFFLIDVQMGACLQTSRLKQAISSVQLFVQRCLLGLEEEKNPSIKNDTLDRKRWEWMSKQTIWTANRKVFLTPENYLISSLRDDKSPLYSTLESDLMQQDVNMQAVVDSVKSYLFGMDQVSNLAVQGLFQDDDNANKTIYIVAKTRAAPYLFFYRTYSTANMWSPGWQAIPVDIPTYHVDAHDSYSAADGSFVIPVVLNTRFLVFFAQMTLKSSPPDTLSTIQLAAPTTVGAVQRLQTWEIKLGWTELRNGKWSPKQLTIDAIMEAPSKTLPSMELYRFVPQIVKESLPSGATSTPAKYISIGVFNSANSFVGGFEFHGSQAFAVNALSSNAVSTFSWATKTQFHLTVGSLPDSSTNPPTAGVPATIYSLQVTSSTFDPTSRPYVQYPLEAKSTSTLVLSTTSSIPFYHGFSHQLLSIANASQTLDPVYATYFNQPDTDAVQDFGLQSTTTDPDSFRHYSSYDELFAPYALYNWEVGFHLPLALADSMLQNQQFDNALAMCHLVFDPYADGSDSSRVWKWAPFANVNAVNVLETLFNGLQPNTPDLIGGPIDSWRNNPFAPHVVARQRPVAYMKWTVMKYLQILIAYGDYYFRQNSLEAIPLAIQCYILASHIYGPRAQQIPRRGKVKPRSYYSLLDKWDAFSNAVVDMELAFPFSNQTPHPVEFLGKDVVLANIFGFATSHYFSIPDNPQLTALRDLIDDRLFKIRHCQDINGNQISLPLWDPPINPALLVAAVAEGLSLTSFLNDLSAPIPNYRFFWLLQKAVEVCNELKSMTAQFLALKEKRDSEALQLLHSNQDAAIQALVMKVRTLQLDEANKAVDTLRSSRGGPLSRYAYYTALAGVTPAALAETDTDYKDIPLTIPAPIVDGDLVITSYEKNEIDEASTANDFSKAIGALEVLAGICFAFPKIGEKAEPWGLGASLSMGPNNIGQSATANARGLRIAADAHTYSSVSSGRKANFVRQYQERVQAANNAGYELLNINKQMVAASARVTTATQEIANQQKVIDNAAETLDFLKNKYTNDALYAWIEASVRTLHYQTYTLAYDLAKKAESAYVFERGPQTVPFVQFGYWDPSHDGLQCGEQLMLALRRLEVAYQEQRGYDFEITKPISLRQVNPYALMQLRTGGSCTFDLPEVLFDMDFPGHYMRRIKAVSLTIPCVLGPYTSVNCTLRLTKHIYRTSALGATSPATYAPNTDQGPDKRFTTSSVPINAIAVSNAQADTGAFELNFIGERYLPFEGAGAISSWQLDLPPVSFRQFDYSSISDVILTLKYTSVDGGAALGAPAAASVVSFIKDPQGLGEHQGLFALFDLRSEFASEWARFAAPQSPPPPSSSSSGPSSSTASPVPTRTLTLKNLISLLPAFSSRNPSYTPVAQDISILQQPQQPPPNSSSTTTASPIPPTAFSLAPDPTGTSDAITFSPAPPISSDMTVASSETELGIKLRDDAGPWVLSATNVPATQQITGRAWLMIRYSLVKQGA
jgi:hypothetical protein